MINNKQVGLYLSVKTYSFNQSTMIKKAGWLLTLAFVWACNNDKKEIPDVSDIKVDIKLERFDRDN